MNCLKVALYRGAPYVTVIKNVSIKHNQYVGYNRDNLDSMNNDILDFLIERAITNPLIIKNILTPRYPYLEIIPISSNSIVVMSCAENPLKV